MNARRLVSIAVFTALITVGGLVSVPIPFAQVELSFQTLFVIMAGMLLGGRDGALAVLVYLVMGLLGLPVFTQGGGVMYVFKPSFGYLIGFPIGALVSGALCSRRKSLSRGRAFVYALVGMLPVYAVGVAYQTLILYYYVGSAWAAVVGGLPAIAVLALKDAVLLGLASSLYPALKRAVRGRRGREKRKSDASDGAIKLPSAQVSE